MLFNLRLLRIHVKREPGGNTASTLGSKAPVSVSLEFGENVAMAIHLLRTPIFRDELTVPEARSMSRRPHLLLRLLLSLFFLAALPAVARPRARDLGIPFNGSPGPLNAITDVRGVEVGHATIVSGEGKLVPGQGPVRTGVSVVFP